MSNDSADQNLSAPEPSITELVKEVLRDVIAELREQSHDHHWDILGVNHQAGPIHPRLITPVTYILVQCSICNLPQSLQLEGHWTEEQVRGKLHGDTTAD